MMKAAKAVAPPKGAPGKIKQWARAGGPPLGTRTGSAASPISAWHFNVGQRLLKTRLERGVTQFDLAKRLGVAQLYISRYENGLKNMGITHLAHIATALDVSTDYLLLLQEDEV